MNNVAVAERIQTYGIDASHSEVGFTVRHMGFSKVRGAFESFDGVIRMEPGELDTIEAEVDVQAKSITTNDQKRDEHLRSGDFLLVDEHPTLRFESTGVKNISGDSFELEGDLTIRGVTKRVTFDAEYLGSGTDPWGGTRVAFTAQTTINRKDFGVNWNAILETGGFLVSEDVTLQIDVQAVEQDD